jgi:CBS domain-containing protein
MRTCDIMSSPVVTVTPHDTVKHAASLLVDNGFTALPVLDDSSGLIGIVTESDLMRDRFPRDPRHRVDEDRVVRADEAGHPPATSVGDVMTSPAISGNGTTDVVDLVTAMVNHHLRSMPVVDGARLVGIVTRRDLMRVLARDDQAVAADVVRRLRVYGGPDRWTVGVHDGAVAIGDEFDDAADRHVAAVLAEAVPGVTSVRVTGNVDRDPTGHQDAGWANGVSIRHRGVRP